MAFTHVGTKYIKRQQDFDNFLKFRHTLLNTVEKGGDKSLPAVLQVVLVGDRDQFRLVPDQSDLAADFRGDLRTM